MTGHPASVLHVGASGPDYSLAKRRGGSGRQGFAQPREAGCQPLSHSVKTTGEFESTLASGTDQEVLDSFREVRDEIRRRLRTLFR